jgi:hypothetical protein
MDGRSSTVIRASVVRDSQAIVPHHTTNLTRVSDLHGSNKG